MKVFILNLKRSNDRRERMNNSLNGKIKFEFIDAVDSKLPNFLYQDRKDDAMTRRRFGYILVDSELACFASHHLAWEKCLELNEPIIVLEDNCDITDDFFENYSEFHKLADKYDFIKLSATFKKKHTKIESFNSKFDVVHYKKRSCGIMGYIITVKAAKSFVNNANKFIEPVDDYMEKNYKHGVRTYCINPDIVMRAEIPSMIGNNRKDKTGIKLSDKLYIEAFRVYEQFMDKFKY